jgi:hypothetical protein
MPQTVHSRFSSVKLKSTVPQTPLEQPLSSEHDTHRWIFTTSKRTQHDAREAVKLFKGAPRRSRRDEKVADVEVKVNTFGLANMHWISASLDPTSSTCSAEYVSASQPTIASITSFKARIMLTRTSYANAALSLYVSKASAYNAQDNATVIEVRTWGSSYYIRGVGGTKVLITSFLDNVPVLRYELTWSVSR